MSESIADRLSKSGYNHMDVNGVKVLISPDIRLADDASLTMYSILGLKFFETRGIVPMKLSCSLSSAH